MRNMWRFAAASLVLVACALGLNACANVHPNPRPLAAGVSFAGIWDSTWGRMELHQEGKKVHGTFTGYREGGVTGQLDGDVYNFIWDQRVPRQHGHGFLQLSPDGLHLEGRWGYVSDDNQGGRWAADRDTNAQ